MCHCACRCRGKFVAPGKYFPPPYSHDVTNRNPNPNPNPNFSPNPNPTPNPNPNLSLNPIDNLNPNPYCCMWELFSGVMKFLRHRNCQTVEAEHECDRQTNDTTEKCIGIGRVARAASSESIQ